MLTGSRLALAGLVFLGLAMSGAILLVSDYLFSTTAAVLTTVPIALFLLGVWFGSPLVRAQRGRDHDGYG